MCGIAGIVGFGSPVNKDQLLSMLPGIRHRGPDGVGYFLDNNIGLLHARLSIIDTSDLANQPLYNEDKTLVLVCNGEIYNHINLRQELEEKGHRFHCQSDSEVLLHLYEEHREQPNHMLNLLKGMFAFALYDIQRSELFIARDRFGIKPLYYSTDATSFCFASEIKSFEGIRPDLAHDVDYTSLFEYYQFLSIPEPNTIYKSIKALPAGHYATVKGGRFLIHEWYALEKVISTPKFSSFDDFSVQLYDKIEKSIDEHLIADVPIGSFLSAGIDSTMVTHFASAHANSSFTSISAGFPGDPEDESVVANDTATKMGVRHHTFSLKGGFFDDADKIIKHFDQPFAVSSAFSLFRISKLARKEMKVVLTGDGADEVFAGYGLKHDPYQVPAVVKRTPAFLYPVMGFVSNLISNEGLSHHYRAIAAEKFIKRNRVVGQEEALSLIPVGKRSEVNLSRFKKYVDGIISRVTHLPWLHQLLFADLHTFLISEMLYKVDRMTMANGLEARVPFLDHEVVEIAFRAPVQFLRENGIGKLPLRNWVNGHYPGLGSRPKTGFNAPLGRMLREDRETREKVTHLLNVACESSLIEHSTIEEICKNFEKNETTDVNIMMTTTCLGGWLKK